MVTGNLVSWDCWLLCWLCNYHLLAHFTTKQCERQSQNVTAWSTCRSNL